MRSGSTQIELSLPTEPHQQGPDLHEDSSPWATTRQRNTKDPYDLILSNSKIRALERRETTGRHEFTARRLAEASLGARHAGGGIRASLPRFAPGPRRTPCVKYDFARNYLSSRDYTRTYSSMLRGDTSCVWGQGKSSTSTDDPCHVAGSSPALFRPRRCPRRLGVLVVLVLGIVLGVVIGERARA